MVSRVPVSAPRSDVAGRALAGCEVHSVGGRLKRNSAPPMLQIVAQRFLQTKQATKAHALLASYECADDRASYLRADLPDPRLLAHAEAGVVGVYESGRSCRSDGRSISIKMDGVSSLTEGTTFEHWRVLSRHAVQFARDQ